jgi:hypothetical protein
MRRLIRTGSLSIFFVGLLCTACTEYDIIGPGEWQPADQPEQLGETYLEDEFIQRTAEASDILFVIDNSCSMQEEQNALQTNFWNFIQFFVGSGLDYHIGVTVLDDWANQPPIGQLYGSTRYIDPTTPDPVGAFTANMTMGDDGMGACEVGLEASYRALTPPLVSGYNAGFYREDALLSIVIVSDEVDGSVTGCDAISYMEYIPWLTTLKGSHSIDMIHFAAIVGDQPNGCTSNWGDADPGRGYYEVYTALGDEHSTYFSVCDQDWSEVMTRLGLEAAGLRTSFHLSLVPVAGTLQVFLDPDGEDGNEYGNEDEFEIFEDPTYSQPYSFIYNRVSNSLDFTFDTMPPESAKLRVVYQVAEDA